MNEDARRFRQRIACVADSSRFEIVLLLSVGEQCASALARRIGRSQSCTTRHLQALQRHGLVRGRRDGKQVLFELCGDEPEVQIVVNAARAGLAGGETDWGADGRRLPGSAAPPELDRPGREARRAPRRVAARRRRDESSGAVGDGAPSAGPSSAAAFDPMTDLTGATDSNAADEVSEAERDHAPRPPAAHDLEDYLL